MFDGKLVECMLTLPWEPQDVAHLSYLTRPPFPCYIENEGGRDTRKGKTMTSIIITDKSGYKGFPIAVIDDCGETYVIARWFETFAGETCSIVSAERIEDVNLLVSETYKEREIRAAVREF